MKISKRLPEVLFLTLLLGGVVGVAPIITAPAIAIQVQPQWIPQFNPEKQIYINPVLQDSPLAPDLHLLEAALEENDDIRVYLIATTGAGEGNQALARAAADQIAGTWQSNSQFDSQRSLIIYWIIRTDLPGRGSVAANGGVTLRNAGVTPTWLSAPDGGVIPALRTHMPGDPNGAFIAIVEGVEEKLWWSKFWEIAPGVLLITAGLVIGSVTLTRIALKRRQSWLEAKGFVEYWSERMQTANQNYSHLVDAYLGFFLNEKDWETKFTGTTLISYKMAAQSFATLAVYIEAANIRQQEAQQALSRRNLQRAKKLLQEQPIVVAGGEIRSAEVRSLFAKLVPEAELLPETLMSQMDQLYQTVDTRMSEIVRVFNQVQQISTVHISVTQLLADMEQPLSAVGLAIAPYKNRLAVIGKAIEQSKPQWDSDPLDPTAGIAKTLSELQQVGADVTEALELAKAVQTAQELHSKTKQQVSDLRSQLIQYEYPLLPEESAPKEQQTFLLQEQGTHLDQDLSDAASALEAAWMLLEEGVLSSTKEELETVQKLCQVVSHCCDQTLSQKQALPQLVQELRGLIVELAQVIQLAKVAQADLESEFLPESFVAESAAFAETVNRFPSFQQQQGDIKEAYDRQNYLTAYRYASQAIEHSQQGIASCNALIEILETLRKARLEVRQGVEALKTQSDRLRQLQQMHQFVTTLETDKQINHLLAEYTSISASAFQEKANWIELLRVNTIPKKIEELIKTIYASVDACQAAKDAINKLSEVINTSRRAVSHADVTRQPAEILSNATHTLTQLQDNITQPKSNWKGLQKQAEKTIQQVLEAANIAEKNIQEAATAREAIASAERSIASADRHYGESVTADLSAARYSLQTARAYYQNKEYYASAENARSSSNSAYSAEQDAERKARDLYQERTLRVSSYSNSSSSGSSSSWSSYSSESSSSDYSSSSSSDYGGSSGGGDYSSGSGGGDY